MTERGEVARRRRRAEERDLHSFLPLSLPERKIIKEDWVSLTFLEWNPHEGV